MIVWQMLARIAAVLATFFGVALAGLPAAAAELVMVEQQGCVYCEQWNEEIAAIYPKTEEGRLAPLHRIDISEVVPEGMVFARGVNFTPTFILVENGRELDRIEGYPGEDFFWGLLGMLLKRHHFMGGDS